MCTYLSHNDSQFVLDYHLDIYGTNAGDGPYRWVPANFCFSTSSIRLVHCAGGLASYSSGWTTNIRNHTLKCSTILQTKDGMVGGLPRWFNIQRSSASRCILSALQNWNILPNHLVQQPLWLRIRTLFGIAWFQSQQNSRPQIGGL
jgi:hypothetical protein